MSDAVGSVRTPHGVVACPAFLPDATRAVVRAVDSSDLEACGVPGVVMSTFHVMRTPGSSTIAALGGLHAMTGWPHTIVTDSGGFQAFSLIREQPKLGGLSDGGLHFTPEGSERKFTLTPEKSVRLQITYGADVAICLDQCTHADDPDDVQDRAVARTIAWAKRGRAEADRLLTQKRVAGADRPLLFGVVQGGRSLDRRRRCADALLELGLQGFGFGGWPLAASGELLLDLIAATRALIPRDVPFHALGVGHPESVVACARAGCNLFDSALPTRDARRGRLYTFDREPPRHSRDLESRWFAFLYIQDEQHVKRDDPICPGCRCACCTRYSIGYLHHLFELEDALYPRLATIHNLSFMQRLMTMLRGDAVAP
ncbi:MAG: tRNA-ribosyltransferase family protein [Vicinamibacterales bacterium]